MLSKLKSFFTGKDSSNTSQTNIDTPQIKQSAQTTSQTNIDTPQIKQSAQTTSLTQKIANIAYNSNLQKIAREYNLNINSVTWEDTGRFKGSCWGPNISDMTLKLDKEHILLPVIRRPNFSDETADLPIKNFTLMTGNEKGDKQLKKVSLRDYLQNKEGYIKDVNGNPVKSLLCEERDEVILTSAQYCILPLNKGTCEFNVNLYNYQSSSSSPGVLVIVASSQGSSAQAIYGGTTALYFNNKGKAANYVAERLKDERERLGKAIEGKMDKDEQERNALFIYQIPLKITSRTRCDDYGGIMLADCIESESFSVNKKCLSRDTRGMDNAVIKVGNTHSDFKGITSAEIERDPQFPIRCTVQFYKVTDEEDVPVEEFKEMAQNIERIYKSTDQSGSLVTGNSNRKTEWVNNN